MINNKYAAVPLENAENITSYFPIVWEFFRLEDDLTLKQYKGFEVPILYAETEAEILANNGFPFISANAFNAWLYFNEPAETI